MSFGSLPTIITKMTFINMVAVLTSYIHFLSIMLFNCELLQSQVYIDKNNFKG